MSNEHIDLDYTTTFKTFTTDHRQAATVGPYRILIAALTVTFPPPDPHTNTNITVTLSKNGERMAFAYVPTVDEAKQRANEWIALEEGWTE